MLGSGLQLNKSRKCEDRFYSVARARRGQSQSTQRHDHLRRAHSDVARESQANESPENYESGEMPVAEVTKKPALKSSALPCNLQQFLESVTPSISYQCLSKTKTEDWTMCDEQLEQYFVLDDLWESLKEWSAYGTGVPIILNDGDNAIQYYVPSLSGIQLYGDSTKSSLKIRRMGEDSDVDYFRDSTSDGSSDSEQNTLRDPQMYDHQKNQEGFSSDGSEFGNSQGCLLFEYFEHDQPYSRVPLYDKISDLAKHFPELKTLRSCDLLSSSWISVAWYPIYRIPMGAPIKALEACFLSYHHLHTPMTEVEDGSENISLPVFGLASYKLKGSLWTPKGGSEKQLIKTLVQAVENWLTLLQINHPDFSFFQRGYN